MKRYEVRARIEEFGILPSVRVTSREMARFAAETVYSAGIPVVEITMTTPGALDVIDDLAKRYPDMAVGAGTVLDEEAARAAIDAGARFLTSPGFVPEVAAYANLVDVVVLPGALTPTEIISAGATAIGLGGELFPKEALHFRQTDRIHELAKRFLGLVRDARALRDTYY